MHCAGERGFDRGDYYDAPRVQQPAGAADADMSEDEEDAERKRGKKGAKDKKHKKEKKHKREKRKRRSAEPGGEGDEEESEQAPQQQHKGGFTQHDDRMQRPVQDRWAPMLLYGQAAPTMAHSAA